ncbi:hypothetical protein GCM10007147_32980 [Nocardiopsis kunsanensis]|uniref:Uncharacterized protein n=1 Tax=Nocardiopsis kunsanensis TaxID=141693 RepID=A0A919CJU4_9ACTN|nr:hypothetical protein [Nocardiopsis kunsanensis]GHD30852.1 hypothetical protein GCM10007147_32980 [Nocardiopsis kunsanensis]
MVRLSFTVTVVALVVTPVLLVAAMTINEPTPLLWALWPVWAVLVLGAVLIYRLARHRL